MRKGSIAFTNGFVLNPDYPHSICQSLLIEDGVVSLLGPAAAIERIAREKNIPIVALHGRTVLPGPIDTHFHLLGTGMHLLSLDFNPCRSIDEILQLLREHVRETAPGQWLLGKGLDEFTLQEQRPPTAQELDAVSQEVPVFIEDRGLHYCLLNTLAVTTMGLGSDAPGVSKHADGKTIPGQFREESMGAVRRRLLQLMNREQVRRMIRRAATFAACQGITTLHAMEGEMFFGDETIPLLLAMRETLPVRMSLHWNTFHYQAVTQAGLRVLGGDILLDGSLGAYTAALSSPYRDQPHSTGRLYYASEKLEELICGCLSVGVQVGFHAIGDRAIEQALAAFEAAAKQGYALANGLRLDHFGLPSPEQIARAADLGVVIATQPTFPYLRGGSGSVYASRLGVERAQRAYPLRECLEAGLLVAGGSDSPVLQADVMLGIHAAVNHPSPAQRISVREAVKLYTLNAAKIEGEENLKGTISVGKLGDVIVLEQDPCQAAPNKLQELPVLMTVVNGVVVYERTCGFQIRESAGWQRKGDMSPHSFPALPEIR